MKFVFFIILFAIVQATSSNKPDFGTDKWMVYNTGWVKFQKIKKGVRFFADECMVRFVKPKNKRPDGNFKMEWVSDKQFNLFVTKKGKKNGKDRTGYYKQPRVFTLRKPTRRFQKKVKEGNDLIWVEKRRLIKTRRSKFYQRFYYVVWLQKGETESKLTTVAETAETCATAGQFNTNTWKQAYKKNGGKIFDKCGISVSETCEGAEVAMSEEGWQQIADEAVDGANFVLKAMIVTGSSGMSFNMIRGVNSARCVLSSGGSNFWNLLASLWYAAKHFEYEEEVEKLVAEYYPYECTCTEEINELHKKLGAKAKAQVIMSGCSELVQQNSANNSEVDDGGVPQDEVDEADKEEEEDKETS